MRVGHEAAATDAAARRRHQATGRLFLLFLRLPLNVRFDTHVGLQFRLSPSVRVRVQLIGHARNNM